nr:MAG TPA: hypothetical protein [Caudoviricetes sp.]
MRYSNNLSFYLSDYIFILYRSLALPLMYQ